MFSATDNVYSIGIIFVIFLLLAFGDGYHSGQNDSYGQYCNPLTNIMVQSSELLDSKSASSSDIGSDVDLIRYRGCVFCRTHLNPSNKFRSSVTGIHFTLFFGLYY